SIEGSTELAFTEDVGTRFLAYGWNVVHLRDANDTKGLADALRDFDREQSRPTMIIVESHIGYGAPHKQDTREAHGEALGEDEVKLAKEFYGWDPDSHFLVPDGVREHFQPQFGRRGAEEHARWNQLVTTYQKQFPAAGVER